jgi:hypothetical protein
MSNAPFDLQRAHRWFAVEFNNLVWDTLELPERTDEQSERMVHAAHAACFHWEEVGTALNRLRALCLLATVHARVGFAETAVHYATQCVALCEAGTEGQQPFDVATAYGCAALAYGCAGHADKAEEMRAKAGAVVSTFTDADDKAVFERFYGQG